MPSTLSPRRRSLLLAGTALATSLLASNATAQTFPNRPVRSVAPYSPGSGPDSVMRILGEKLSREWGQQLVIDNKPGGNGCIAIGEAKRAAPDGYTVMQVDNTHMALQPHLFKQLPYNPVRDFDPVAPLYSTNFFIVVAANSPWKDVRDLVNAAKAAIEKINADVATVLQAPDVRDRLAAFGFVPCLGGPDELTQAIERDSRRFGEIVRRAKISLD